jgi:hypothetical protein
MEPSNPAAKKPRTNSSASKEDVRSQVLETLNANEALSEAEERAARALRLTPRRALMTKVMAGSKAAADKISQAGSRKRSVGNAETTTDVRPDDTGDQAM